MKNKRYTYHKSLTYEINGIKISIATQFYQIGIYTVIEPNTIQLSMHPKELVKSEKNLIKAQKEGVISNLVFGQSITVEDDGLLKIIEE